MIACSIGVMAYNEERNIARFLEAILSQQLNKVRIREIFVIASGCTDRTVPISQRLAKTDKRIKILTQKRREGKPSAVNLFLKHAKSKVVVIAGADTIPRTDVIEKLVVPFADPEVGMTGARPVPVDSKNSFFGFAANLLWELHHQISLKTPKMGEMVAFRKIFQRIPYVSVVDEATVEPLIVGQGYRLVYVPRAIVQNKGTESLKEFLKQRRRIHAGHLALVRLHGYRVATIQKRNLIPAVLKTFKPKARYFLFLPLVAVLEATARVLGNYDFYFKKDKHTIWEVIHSTKKLK